MRTWQFILFFALLFCRLSGTSEISEIKNKGYDKAASIRPIVDGSTRVKRKIKVRIRKIVKGDSWMPTDTGGEEADIYRQLLGTNTDLRRRRRANSEKSNSYRDKSNRSQSNQNKSSRSKVPRNQRHRSHSHKNQRHRDQSRRNQPNRCKLHRNQPHRGHSHQNQPHRGQLLQDQPHREQSHWNQRNRCKSHRNHSHRSHSHRNHHNRSQSQRNKPHHSHLNLNKPFNHKPRCKHLHRSQPHSNQPNRKQSYRGQLHHGQPNGSLPHPVKHINSTANYSQWNHSQIHGNQTQRHQGQVESQPNQPQSSPSVNEKILNNIIDESDKKSSPSVFDDDDGNDGTLYLRQRRSRPNNHASAYHKSSSENKIAGKKKILGLFPANSHKSMNVLKKTQLRRDISSSDPGSRSTNSNDDINRQKIDRNSEDDPEETDEEEAVTADESNRHTGEDSKNVNKEKDTSSGQKEIGRPIRKKVLFNIHIKIKKPIQADDDVSNKNGYIEHSSSSEYLDTSSDDFNCSESSFDNENEALGTDMREDVPSVRSGLPSDNTDTNAYRTYKNDDAAVSHPGYQSNLVIKSPPEPVSLSLSKTNVGARPDTPSILVSDSSMPDSTSTTLNNIHRQPRLPRAIAYEETIADPNAGSMVTPSGESGLPAVKIVQLDTQNEGENVLLNIGVEVEM